MSARSGEQKPVRMQRGMKAKIFCLSLALENPHQALDAYISFATATARKTSCSESSHNPCLHRTRSAYRVCEQAAMTLCTCGVTDRLLVNVTPRILIVCTRWSSGILPGIENFVFRLLSVKIISWLFVKLSFRLLANAHSLTLCYMLRGVQGAKLLADSRFINYCAFCAGKWTSLSRDDDK